MPYSFIMRRKYFAGSACIITNIDKNKYVNLCCKKHSFEASKVVDKPLKVIN